MVRNVFWRKHGIWWITATWPEICMVTWYKRSAGRPVNTKVGFETCGALHQRRVCFFIFVYFTADRKQRASPEITKDSLFYIRSAFPNSRKFCMFSRMSCCNILTEWLEWCDTVTWRNSWTRSATTIARGHAPLQYLETCTQSERVHTK
jgi:hypothetical protein